MPTKRKTSRASQVRPSSFLTVLSGWVEQGVENFFATQRSLFDLAMRQNSAAVKRLREGLSDPEHSPVAILKELAVEGTSSFVEVQRILLNLAQQENEIVMGGVKERVAGSVPATVTAELVSRTIDNLVRTQHEFLKITNKQVLGWLEQAGKGKHIGTHLTELAREAMQTFVDAQKKFLDVIVQETARLTSGRREKAAKAVKRTELAKLARDASNAFLEAQKKLLDVAGEQMNVNLKAATRATGIINPFRLLPMANITGEGVKRIVDAEKALIGSVAKTRSTSRPAVRRAKRARKEATPHAEHAVA